MLKRKLTIQTYKTYFDFQINIFRFIRGDSQQFQTYCQQQQRKKLSTNTCKYFCQSLTVFETVFKYPPPPIHLEILQFLEKILSFDCRYRNMSRQSQFINSDIVSARVLNTPESAYQDLRHPITIVFRVEVWLNDNVDIVIYTISLYIHFTCTFIIYRHAIPIYISYFFRIQHGIHLFNELVLHLI